MIKSEVLMLLVPCLIWALFAVYVLNQLGGLFGAALASLGL